MSITGKIPGTIDMHVHVVGSGSDQTGCWMRPPGVRWPLQALMLKHIGLPLSALKRDFDRLYIDRLRELLDQSSLERAVILAQDDVYGPDGKSCPGLGTFYVPNRHVLDLARRHRQFLAGVSIHPGRGDAMEELEFCLSEGAVLMKCLPNCQDIDCNDRRFAPFWERMAEAGLPLLAHTGGEHTLRVVRRELADPRTLQLPLECGVTVIAAHCGTKSGLFDRQYFPIFLEMLKKYPRLYGDISAFNVPIRGRVIPAALKAPVLERLVHGSDFPVPVYGVWGWMGGKVSFRAFIESCRQPNVLERDVALKRAMGFPHETFTRVKGLLRKSRVAP